MSIQMDIFNYNGFLLQLILQFYVIQSMDDIPSKCKVCLTINETYYLI